MNWDSLELYNAGAVEAVPGLGENGLVRIPQKVRNQLNQRARFVGMDSVGCEIRFVSAAPNIDVLVSCSDPEFSPRGEMRVFRGNFQCGVYEVEPGQVKKIRLNHPEPFNAATAEAKNDGGFASDVWRLTMDRGATMVIHGIDFHGNDFRQPTAAELPEINWLAYGSSITNSSLDGYPHVAARVLRAQVQNKGMSGACHLEPVLVDWLVNECTWDIATIEMGINMRGCFTPAEFEERAAYTIETFGKTGKPVLVTNLYPNCHTPGKAVDETNDPSVREKAFNETVERRVAASAHDNVKFVHGYEILDDFAGLGGDLLHPCGYGHAIMGMNLARLIRQKLL